MAIPGLSGGTFDKRQQNRMGVVTAISLLGIQSPARTVISFSVKGLATLSEDENPLRPLHSAPSSLPRPPCASYPLPRLPRASSSSSLASLRFFFSSS